MKLAVRPEQGSVIPGTGGLRKVRWRVKGKGKRGGLRVIYYWTSEESTIYMLMLYERSEQADLTPAQTKVLKKLVEEELK